MVRRLLREQGNIILETTFLSTVTSLRGGKKWGFATAHRQVAAPRAQAGPIAITSPKWNRQPDYSMGSQEEDDTSDKFAMLHLRLCRLDEQIPHEEAQ